MESIRIPRRRHIAGCPDAPHLVFYLIFLFLPPAVLCGLCPPAATQSAAPPFASGERLTFQIRWGFIPAGQAVLEVLPHTSINGTEARHFVLTAQTNAVVDLIYRVRQRIDAYSDLAMTRSLLYREIQSVNRRQRDVRIDFDWERMQARRTNFQKQKRPIAIPPGSFDPLSAFYFTRFLALGARSEIQRPITDGKRSVIGRARIVKRETIVVSGRPYDTYLMRPELKHVRGVFEKSKNAKIELWITADHRKVPVRIKSKVVVGSFVGELIEARYGL